MWSIQDPILNCNSKITATLKTERFLRCCTQIHLTKFGLNWYEAINSLYLLYSYTIYHKYWNISWQKYYWFGFSLLYFVCALDCFSIIKQKTSEFWCTLGSKIFNCEIVDQKYMIPYWWWRTGDLSCYLGSVPKVVIDKIYSKIHILKLTIISSSY